MENTVVTNAKPTSNLGLILLAFTVFVFLVNVLTYSCSWYGRKPMTPEELAGDKEKYFEDKKPWNTAVFYLLGASTFATFVQMIIIMWQAWGIHKTSKAEILKKNQLQESSNFV